MPRLDWLRVIGTAALLTLLASACLEAPDTITLGPRGPRPPLASDDDAGIVPPEGALLCDTSADCDDGVECTLDTCVEGGYCRSVTDYASCSDGMYCNGIEICDSALGCIPGVVPTCDDENTCTIDRCDDDLGACVHAPRDFDHDGETDVHCPGGTDCDDFDETRGTRVSEICGDRADNDCDEVIDEAVCGKPMHDTCEDVLDIGEGGTFEVSLAGAVGDYETSCGTATDTRDVVFGFELTETRDVKLEARGILVDGTMDEIAVLSLQTTCGAASSEIQCARSYPADLRVRALPAGQYYVVAASYATRSLVLSASTSPATEAPTNMTCETALDVGGGGRFEGDFVDVGDETMSACGDAGQPDVFYSFTLTEVHDVEISAVSDEGGKLTVSVRNGCEDDAKVEGCRFAEPALTRLHQLEPGNYVIALEGPPSREVSYSLEVAILEPTPAPVGDTCESPMPIAFGTPELVPLFDKQAEIESSCETTGPDAVFSLQLDTARDVQIKVDAEDALAVVALQSTCGDIQTERGCRKGGPLNARLRNVAPGSYFVIVDSQTAPSVTVQVETYPPTPTTMVENNDTCQTAYDIPAMGGVFSGDTRLLRSDYGSFCGQEAMSPDALFRLELTSTKKVQASLESGFEGVLHRMRDDQAPAQACRPWVSDRCDEGNATAGPLLDDTLEPGIYYFAVDGKRDTNAGFYTFDVSVTDPP